MVSSKMESAEIGQLYRRFGPLVYRRCKKFLIDNEMARDATQEVFVRAMRHATRLIADRECLPWLYRVTTNLCLNVIREESKITRLPLSEWDGAEERGDIIESRCEARETIARLLAELGDTNAQIALYAHWDRMNQEEIAAVMGLSRRTVGKRIKQIFNAADRFLRQDEERE